VTVLPKCQACGELGSHACNDGQFKLVRRSAAARTEFILDLVLGLPHHDEDGNVIGRGQPLITREEALLLLKDPA
jgi:hypothetical protein